MASIAALWPAVAGTIGIATAVARYVSGESKKPDATVKYTLVPPLFDPRVDCNEAIRSPQQSWRLHRLSLLDAHFVDAHTLIGNIRLQPSQAVGGHDIVALVRVPSSDSDALWLSSSLSPIADFIARVQPSPTERTFAEARLSTDSGGRADVSGCYQLPLSKVTSRMAVDTRLVPSLAVFGRAPIFDSGVESAGSVNGTVDLGLRADHLYTSAGVTVNPVNPDLLRGWLTSIMPISDEGLSALRGGLEFSTPTTFDRTPQCDVSLYYTQAQEKAKDNDYSNFHRPAYEIGLELRKGGEELTASFYNFQSVRRAVRNPMEDSSVIQIVNYIELGLELNLARHQQPTWRTAASWQLNKNSLVKLRLSESVASAAYSFRSWWSPSFAFSTAVHRSLSTGHVSVGLELSVENLSAVVFGRAPERYTRKVEARRLDVTKEAASGKY